MNCWRTIIHHPWLMPYNLLIISVCLINVLFFYHWQPSTQLNKTIAMVFNFVIGNFFIALLFRQQYVINGLFRLATSLPLSWPLAVRRVSAKVYHFGGVSVGCYLSGALWLFILCLHLTASPVGELFYLIVGHTLVLLVVMVVALPPLRARYHNFFEIIARYGNWLALAFFYLECLIFLSISLLQAVLLAIMTWHMLLPWLRLRRVAVNIDSPSRHVALVSFNYGVTPFAGSSTELSRCPWREWHAFANVPSPQRAGFRLTISRAGDWTAKLIDERPRYLWVKGIPTAGVGNIDKLFKRVVWLATGSGIGPCLPHLLAKTAPAHLVWVTRAPQQTYGQALVEEILANVQQATIWNTSEHGKPNLVTLAEDAYHTFKAEAVICIANKQATWRVVHQLESRGIPAYGAIWDS